MKISLVPWEIIWIVSLLTGLVLGLWASIKWWRRRRLAPRLVLALVGLGLILILTPPGLHLLGYQFRLDGTNTSITQVAHEKPQLRTHIYSMPASRVYDASLEAVKSIKTWGFPWTITFLGREDTGGVIRAEVHLLFLTDDLLLFVRQFPDGVHVNVYSQSRLKTGDLGENDRHIVQFYRALEARLGPPVAR